MASFAAYCADGAGICKVPLGKAASKLQLPVPAVHADPGNAAALADGTGRSAAAAAAAAAATRRSLLEAFEGESELYGDICKTPAKYPRKGGGRTQPCASPVVLLWTAPNEGKGALLLELPTATLVVVASYLPLQETLRLAAVALGAQAILANPGAWDPLIINRKQSGGLLRRLRVVDALGLLAPDNYPLPRGLSQVTRLYMDLMEEAGTLAAVAAASPAAEPRYPVLDPLEELARRLRRGWFSSASHVEISNIEDHRMDYHFLSLRVACFGGFPHVRARAAGGRYNFLALRGAGAPPPAVLASHDLEVMRKLSLARQPPEAPLLMAPPAELCGLEAAFLLENAQAFKSGDRFHFSHAPWRSCEGREVRRRYQAVLRALELAAQGGGAPACRP